MKHEQPPFRMIIERGRLVPATPDDAERLDTFRNGSTVRVRFVEEKDRIMVRKWFAILGRAVKECPTPWKNKEQASEAIKLALGIVNLTKTVRGDFLAYPKSLTELTDPELDDAVNQMIDVIYNVTGVDPAEWRKQVADMRDDEPEPSAGHSADDSSEAESQASLADEPEPDAPEAQDGPDAAPAPVIDPRIRSLMEECRDKFLRAATDPGVPDAKDRQDVVKITKDAWKDALPERLNFVRACTETANRIIKGEVGEAKAREYLQSLIDREAGA